MAIIKFHEPLTIINPIPGNCHKNRKILGGSAPPIPGGPNGSGPETLPVRGSVGRGDLTSRDLKKAMEIHRNVSDVVLIWQCVKTLVPSEPQNSW